jgi:DNA-binding NtrC family response regulator
MERVAPSDANVLITGQHGTGKEVAARWLHAASKRAERPFVAVNAGGLAEGVFESELFGHVRGAFTDARSDRTGCIELADGGTLFLDEIANMPMQQQAKLLRVLQTGEFERLGSSATRKVDARVISATNVDLPRAIASGAFREDLYFRLNVIELQVPALADRVDDIMLLAERFLEAFTRNGAPPCELTTSARDALLVYDWPGNVRELQNRIQRATLVCQNRSIEPEDLGIETARSQPQRDNADVRPTVPDPERALIEEALVRASGVVSKAAAELGMSRQALYRRMERLDIVLERRPRS